jgi:hypothetical protein
MRPMIFAGMLVFAVSASLTPANAGLACPGSSDAEVTAGAHRSGVSRSMVLKRCCIRQCWNDAMRRHFSTEAPTTLWNMFDDKKLQQCQSKCVNAFEASFHREIKTWSETR